MSSEKLRKELKKLMARQIELIEALSNPPAMLRGSFSRVSTKCGKATCWCAEGTKGHPHNRLTWSERGKMITRKVPAEEVVRIMGLIENYRRHREVRRTLRVVQKQVLAMIIKLEAATNEKTRKPLSYLALTPKNAAETGKPVRKTKQSKKRNDA